MCDRGDRETGDATRVVRGMFRRAAGYTDRMPSAGGPTVSIVIPAFNEERRIRACVVAAIEQTEPADEILVVDNRSTDSTLRVLESLQREFPEAPLNDENPMGDHLESFVWPRDPLGDRRATVEAAAASVVAAEPRIAGRFAADLTLLLAERERRLAGSGVVALPTRVSASRFKDFVTEPDAVAASMLRPMPEKPFRATRLGTLFHSWVENRYGITAGADELDASVLRCGGHHEGVHGELGGVLAGQGDHPPKGRPVRRLADRYGVEP